MAELRLYFEEIEEALKELSKEIKGKVTRSAERNVFNFYLDIKDSKEIILSFIKKKEWERILKLMAFLSEKLDEVNADKDSEPTAKAKSLKKYINHSWNRLLKKIKLDLMRLFRMGPEAIKSMVVLKKFLKTV